MTRLPNRLQPLWPTVKRLHRLSSRILGTVSRRLLGLHGSRALPRRGTATSALTASLEPSAVTLHRISNGEPVRRDLAAGSPAAHWIFEEARRFDVPDWYSVEIADGVVVGDYGANITPGGTLDYQTSEYFGISGWREHPIYLRSRLPPIEHVPGSVLSMATRGGSDNYYHFLLDVLPRFGVFEETMPRCQVDALYVPNGAQFQRDLLDLAGLGALPVIQTTKHRAVRADRLIVPSPPNPHEVAPARTIAWLRSRLPATARDGLPARIYVTRGSARNTRRLTHEQQIMSHLERHGFVRIEPGSMSIRDQIDQFAAAEFIIAPHGAALSNLVFVQPRTKVLELFAAGFVKACFWAITQNIPDVQYEYLVADGSERYPDGRPMNRVQADIDLDPAVVIETVERMLTH